MPPIRTGLDERLKTIRNELQIYFDEAKNAYSDAINAFTKLDSEVYSEVKKVRAKAREINWDLTNDLLLILKPLINSESIWKSHGLYLLAEYFFSKNEKQKAKDFFSQIIMLENANQEILKESQKRLNRDLSD